MSKRQVNELLKLVSELRADSTTICDSCNRHSCWERGGITEMFKCPECTPTVSFISPTDTTSPICPTCEFLPFKIPYYAPSLPPANSAGSVIESEASKAEPAAADVYVVLPDMYPKQHAAFYPENDVRTICIEASTKSGKTFGALTWLLRQAFEKGGDGHRQLRRFVWVAPYAQQARDAFMRVANALGPEGYLHKKEGNQDLSIQLHNGSYLNFKSGDNVDSLFGIDATAAVVDESSRLREAAYHSVITNLSATGGPLVLIGNVRGKKNWFYSKCREAQQGEADSSYTKLTYLDAIEAGVMTDATVEMARRDLPTEVFRELYEADAQDDAGNPFGEKNIDECVGVMSDEEPWVWGIDLAKSSDYTVIIGLDKDKNVCYFNRFQQDWDETEYIIERDCFPSQATMLIDSTGVGDAVVERLQKKNQYVEGYRFTSTSKQELMRGLQMAIQENSITYPSADVAPIVTELKNFIYETTRTGTRYEAGYGHDDCVCALALAVKCHDLYGSAGWGIW
jgi:hypothetical protein